MRRKKHLVIFQWPLNPDTLLVATPEAANTVSSESCHSGDLVSLPLVAAAVEFKSVNSLLILTCKSI